MDRMTEADYNGWRFIRDAVHYNGGKVFFGYGHRCVDQPRLLVIDKYFKKDRSTVRSFLVDDETPCATLDEALAVLSEPPKLSAKETGLLRALPDDWTLLEKRAPYVPLTAKGFAEWGRDTDDRVACRRTPAGRRSLSAAKEDQ